MRRDVLRMLCGQRVGQRRGGQESHWRRTVSGLDEGQVLGGGRRDALLGCQVSAVGVVVAVSTEELLRIETIVLGQQVDRLQRPLHRPPEHSTHTHTSVS